MSVDRSEQPPPPLGLGLALRSCVEQRRPQSLPPGRTPPGGARAAVPAHVAVSTDDVTEVPALWVEFINLERALCGAGYRIGQGLSRYRAALTLGGSAAGSRCGGMKR